MRRKKKSLGRDAFEEAVEERTSRSLKKLIRGKGLRAEPGAREVEVRVKLTPSNIKHLDNLVRQLEVEGKGRFSRNQLIRIAITLLCVEDF